MFINLPNFYICNDPLDMTCDAMQSEVDQTNVSIPFTWQCKLGKNFHYLLGGKS